MFGVVTETVDPRDTSGDLLQRLSESGAELLVRTLDGIEDGTVRAESQSADGITHAPKMTAEDAQINWSEPAIGIDRRVRACTPAPGAWTMFRGARLKVGPVVPLAAQDNGLTPGELRVEKSRVLAGTGGGVVELGEIQAQGKRAMRAADWARGMRPEPGERLGDAPA
jgi:methionyl-tRNA formyltransferase